MKPSRFSVDQCHNAKITELHSTTETQRKKENVDGKINKQKQNTNKQLKHNTDQYSEAYIILSARERC